ncbi:hypothetical protein TCAL_14521 [Tigriopus californicus]|uniref:Uncharacterized protein n=1 Tax=Tigriopus californicus TaxID=6832 RepID=A0A553PRR6_TIGCA|nr:hypothetical protein TCAL_14521 [Tigriopus californicus]
MDPYQVHYSSLDSLITVLIWSVLTLGLGNGLLFGIVWSAFVVTLFEGLVLSGLLTLIEIGTIKFLYIVWFKSTGALSDEFFFTFFMILNNALGIYAVIIKLMAATWRTKSFYLLIGEDIKTFDEQEPSPLILDSIILGCLVCSLHIILYVTIFMSNLKPGGRDRSFRRGLNDFVFRLFIMVLAFLGFIPRQIRNKMDMDYFRDHRVVFVSCSYMLSLIISLVWPLLYYWRNNRWAKCTMLKPLISTRAHERCRF